MRHRRALVLTLLAFIVAATSTASAANHTQTRPPGGLQVEDDDVQETRPEYLDGIVRDKADGSILIVAGTTRSVAVRRQVERYHKLSRMR